MEGVELWVSCDLSTWRVDGREEECCLLDDEDFLEVLDLLVRRLDDLEVFAFGGDW